MSNKSAESPAKSRRFRRYVLRGLAAVAVILAVAVDAVWGRARCDPRVFDGALDRARTHRVLFAAVVLAIAVAGRAFDEIVDLG